MSEAKDSEKKLLGKRLVQENLITSEQLDQALEEQKRHGGKIGFLLVRLGLLRARELCAFLQRSPDLARVQDDLMNRRKAAASIPRHLAFYYKIAPIRLEGSTLTLALSRLPHPRFVEILNEVIGMKIDPVIYPEGEVRSLIESTYTLSSDAGIEFSTIGENVFVVVDSRKNVNALAPGQLKNEKNPGEWLRSIVVEAIREKCREIWIRPQARESVVLFKKDTAHLSEFVLSTRLHEDLAFLLFRLGKLDPLQQQVDQSGRFLVKLHNRRIAMVVRAEPGINGARLFLELFDERLLKHSFEEMEKANPALIREVDAFLKLGRKGMCVITAPEGSEKNTILYSILGQFKTLFPKMAIVESATGYPISGANQIRVEEDQIDIALKELLDQQPDLVAVNPLKDPEAAETMFLFASRVPAFALMPSFDCFTAIDWMCNHGLKSALKARLLPLVISPRVIARVCANCSIPYEWHPDELSRFRIPGGARFHANQGCESCRSRENPNAELFFECLKVDEEMISWIETDHSATTLRRQSRAAGRKVLFDLVFGDAFSERFDMFSVMKLKTVL